jgi:hypothetical protein
VEGLPEEIAELALPLPSRTLAQAQRREERRRDSDDSEKITAVEHLDDVSSDDEDDESSDEDEKSDSLIDNLETRRLLPFAAHEVAFAIADRAEGWEATVLDAVTAFEEYVTMEEPEDVPRVEEMALAVDSAKRHALIHQEVAVRRPALGAAAAHTVAESHSGRDAAAADGGALLQAAAWGV